MICAATAQLQRSPLRPTPMLPTPPFSHRTVEFDVKKTAPPEPPTLTPPEPSKVEPPPEKNFIPKLKNEPKTEPPPTKGGGGTTPTEPSKPDTKPAAGELIGGPVPAREPGKLWADPPKMTIEPDGKYVAKIATTDGVIGV